MYVRLFKLAISRLFTVFLGVYALFSTGLEITVTLRMRPVNSIKTIAFQFRKLRLMNSSSKTEETGFPRAMR